MIMADVLKIVLLIVGAQIVFISCWLAAEALFPTLVESARERYRSHPIRISLMGVLALAPLGVLGAALANAPNPAFKLAGAMVLSVPFLLGLLGSAGLSLHVGYGLPSMADERQPWLRVLRGGIVLVFVFLLPFIGWFFLLPWTLVSGLGAAVSAMWSQRKQASPPVTLVEAQGIVG